MQAATLPFVYITELSGEDPKTITTTRRSGDTDPTFHAFGVEIRFQSTDVGGSTAEPTSTSSSSSSSSFDGASSSIEDSEDSGSGGNGISDGVMIGIAVSVGVVLVAIILAAWYIWRRKRASKAQSMEYATPKQVSPEPYIAELDTTENRAELMTEYAAGPSRQREPIELNGDYSRTEDQLSPSHTPMRKVG